MNVNFIKSQKMPNVIKMRGSGSNGFQRKNSKVGKHDWHLDPFGGHSSPFVVIETDIFTIRTPPRDQKRAKFYNLVRTISKAIQPNYVKVNDERDTFISKLEGLRQDYRPWNHFEPSLSVSVVLQKSYFSLHGGISTATICNLLYWCIPVTKCTLQISWRGYGPSSWSKLIRFWLKNVPLTKTYV